MEIIASLRNYWDQQMGDISRGQFALVMATVTVLPNWFIHMISSDNITDISSVAFVLIFSAFFAWNPLKK